MRLIITRHGLTEENLAGIIQGHLPGKLAEEGIIQAQKLALRLKDEKIDFIYSSDLARAADTVKEIAKYHPGTPLIFTEELRERNLGEFQGQKKYQHGITTKSTTAQLEPIHGESVKQLIIRGEKFYQKILTEHPSDCVLLVGHNGINRAIISSITGQDFYGFELQHNTGVSIFEIKGDGHYEIEILNSAHHLD